MSSDKKSDPQNDTKTDPPRRGGAVGRGFAAGGGGGEARAPGDVAAERPRQALGLAGSASESLGEDAVCLPEDSAEIAADAVSKKNRTQNPNFPRLNPRLRGIR